LQSSHLSMVQPNSHSAHGATPSDMISILKIGNQTNKQNRWSGRKLNQAFLLLLS
jgi:hypothetical protein